MLKLVDQQPSGRDLLAIELRRLDETITAIWRLGYHIDQPTLARLLVAEDRISDIIECHSPQAVVVQWSDPR